MVDSDDTAASNIPEYSVSEISGAIRRTLESGFARVRVRGEITELKRYPSGHIYLSLKDEDGKIAGVVWRSAVSRLSLTPENGTEVIATGRVSSYGERSTYQLIIDQMSFAGEGALLARIEKLRLKLLEEGLFAPERKRALPHLPRLVGVVTSQKGAVLHDICTTIARRFPRPVLVWPVPVQGDGAAAQIVAAIEGFRRMKSPPDVLIVARGGGSLEDLMAFNDERVVRAAAASPIPLISAVGHETDTTLIDFASDRRAPTPTAAAELAVPLRSEMVADLAHRNARLAGALMRLMDQARARLERVVAGLPDLPSLLNNARMRLDDRGQRLELALPTVTERARARLVQMEGRLPSLELVVSRLRERVLRQAGQLELAGGRGLQAWESRIIRARLSPESILSASRLREARLEGTVGRLEAVSPRAVLARGYVLVQDMSGRPITSAATNPQGGRIVLEFADGRRDARLDKGRGDGSSPQGEFSL